MNIKDIRQFRSFLKTDIRELDLKNRNEHFAGVRSEVNGESQYGFFEIYHGYKEGTNGEGIRGFLEGFLDMAKDGQAVYEFMQNAVDARSSKFSLFWGKDDVDGQDYLLVANNGEMFSMEAVLSILNVGVSTKSSDNHTIGKFGIGFKLAHRLVGKENGLDELIHENYGPVLFSWKNGEVLSLANLKDSPEVIPVEQSFKSFSSNGNKKATVNSTEPWLFKILVTNFPCQPENDFNPEIIKDAQFKEHSNVFSKSELQTLGRWVEKHKTHLENDYQEGSLFFIRLGKGKQSSLEEENLEEGVRFSLSILNRIAQLSLEHEGLNEVNLNTNPIKPVDLQFESFVIKKESEDFRRIRFGKADNLTDTELIKEKADSNIEILFGFTDHKVSKEVFENAPNLYLFFPLSEEKHRLRFILHSNAFYKSSSRTYLQKGNLGEEGINERLFRVFADALETRMLGWANCESIEHNNDFLEVYANLLLSNESVNPERVWINEPLWKPILEFIQKNIPVKSTLGKGIKLIDNAATVKIKATALPVDQTSWEIPNINWFYWDKTDNIEVRFEAINKLQVSEYNIIDLLGIPGIYEKVNSWLEDNPLNCETVISELDFKINTVTAPESTFVENLCALKMWQFEDGYFSLNQLADSTIYNERILLFESIDPLKPYLEKANFKLLLNSLSNYKSLFYYLRVKLQSQIKYINNYTELIAVFNLRFTNTEFIPEEKHYILKHLASKLRDDKEDRISRLKELRLYSNRMGEIIPLKNILKETDWNWLSGWCVKEEEYASELDEYITVSRDQLYENIILNHWDTLITQPNLSNIICTEIYLNIKALYQETPKAQTLSGKRILKVGDLYLKPDEVNYYYSKALLDFSVTEYGSLDSIFKKFAIGSLPAFNLLSFYQEAPFKIEEKELSIGISFEDLQVTINEAKALIKLCKEKDNTIFEKIILSESDANQELNLSARLNTCFQVATSDGPIAKYIAEYHPVSLIPLPLSVITEAEHLVNYKEDSLLKKLITLCDFNDQEQTASLIKLSSNGSIETKRLLLQNLPKLHYNLDHNLDIDSAEILFLKLVLTLDDDVEKKLWFKEKITLEQEGIAYDLETLHLTGNDDVIFTSDSKEYKLSLSSILINNDSKLTKLVSELADRLADFELADKSTFDKYLGLSGPVDKAFIFNSLLASLEDNLLSNSDQLAFVLLFFKYHPVRFELGEFNVMTGAGNTALNNIDLYSPDRQLPFIPNSLFLTEAYAGLSSKLKLEAHTPFRAANVSIQLSPYIVGSDFHIDGIKAINTLDEKQQLFIFLYKLWRAKEEPPKSIFIAPDKQWKDLLGFEPQLSVLAKTHLHPSEELPDYVARWFEVHETSGGKEFLRALGVSFSGADIIRIRKYLTGEQKEVPQLNYNPHEKLIINSLHLLEESNSVFKLHDSRVDFIKALYGKINSLTEDQPIPLPIISKDVTHSFYFQTIEDAFVLDEAKQTKLKEIGYNLQNLPHHAESPIILSNLLETGFANRISHTYAPLDLTFDTIDEHEIKVSCDEWEKPFYTQWKTSYPGHIIKLCSFGIPRVMKVKGKFCFPYKFGNIASIIDTGVVLINRELNDKTAINLIEDNKYFSAEALNALKSLFEQHEQNIHNYLTHIQSDKRVNDEWKKIQEWAREQEEKKQISDDFSKSDPYTMAWFTNLLKLMLLSGGSGNPGNTDGEIIFNKLEASSIGLQVISLKSPSKAISPNIELYTDFAATITYLDNNNDKKNKNIKIKGVSRKGQGVLALPANINELDGITPDKVVKVKITFKKVIDLLERLTSSFVDLGFDDNYNLKSELSENINFIYGPPGTGKTTTISKLILKKIRDNSPKRILILTPTNKAADVIVSRLLEMSTDDDYVDNWLVRFGYSTNPELMERGLVYDGNNFEYRLYNQCVVVTTIQRFPYEQVKTGKNELGDERIKMRELPWDTIIFDEASMIMLPAIVYPLFKRKYKDNNAEILTEFIVGGDPLQLPPIFDIKDEDLPEGAKDVKEENIYTMVGLKSFSTEIQNTIPIYGERDKIQNLSTQYRSVEPIGRLFSKFQYNDLLSHGRNEGLGGPSESRVLPTFFHELGFKPITVIRYPVNTLDTIYNPQKLKGSPLQLYSAFLVNELIKKFKGVSKGTGSWDLGVICPYRSQATLINKMIEGQTAHNNDVTVITDTVHGFQGDQSDLVFAVLHPSSAKSQYSYFLKKEYILNVAVSRAKDYLVLLIPDEDTDGIRNLSFIHQNHHGSILNIINSLPKEDVAYLSGNEIETRLMGEHEYFKKNSFTSTHESVNIYSSPLMDYMVRLNGDAVDVHYKD